MHGQHGAVPVQIAVDGEEVMEVVYACVVTVIILGITVEPLEIGVPIPAEMLIE